MGALSSAVPSWGLQVHLGCVRLSPACPCRCLHTCHLRPARHYPRLWIRPPSSGGRRDFNPPDQCAAWRTLRASPPPCTARPDPRGLSVGACHATARASRVASTPLFHTCRHHYPGGNGRCSRRSLPGRWQPSPCSRRVGFRIRRFEACAAFTSLRPACSLNRPRRPFVVGVLQPMSLPPSSAPTATGWSDSCRAGFAPAEEWRLSRRTRSLSLPRRDRDARRPALQTITTRCGSRGPIGWSRP